MAEVNPDATTRPAHAETTQASAAGAPCVSVVVASNGSRSTPCSVPARAALVDGSITYIFLNPACFRKPDFCRLASIIMHEMGHLARQDTTDYEPEDFFRTCSAVWVKPERFR